MFTVAFILFLLALGYTFYTDIKQREVALYTLVLLVVAGGFLAQQYLPIVTVGQFWLLNVLFIGIQYGLLMLYLEIRYKEGKQIFSKWIGLGDLLFFLAISIYYPINQFIVVYMGSLIFSAVLYLCFKTKLKTIPLAGFSALFIIFFEIYTKCIEYA